MSEEMSDSGNPFDSYEDALERRSERIYEEEKAFRNDPVGYLSNHIDAQKLTENIFNFDEDDFPLVSLAQAGEGTIIANANGLKQCIIQWGATAVKDHMATNPDGIPIGIGQWESVAPLDRLGYLLEYENPFNIKPLGEALHDERGLTEDDADHISSMLYDMEEDYGWDYLAIFEMAGYEWDDQNGWQSIEE